MTVEIEKQNKKTASESSSVSFTNSHTFQQTLRFFSLRWSWLPALSNIRFEAVRKVELIRHSLSTHADRTRQGALAATQHMANMPGLLQQCSLRTVFEMLVEVALRDLC
jgi:hypothetical protein